MGSLPTREIGKVTIAKTVVIPLTVKEAIVTPVNADEAS